MATAAAPPATAQPRLLKKTYLAEGEVLLREVRATKLFFFPGPIVVLLIVLFLDYLSASAVYHSLPPAPYLTGLFRMIPSLGVHLKFAIYAFFLFVTLLVLLWILIRYMRWIRTVYAVTDHRVIVQRGIVSRDVNEIPVNQVRGVDVHQTGWQRMLGYGTIRLSAEGGPGASIGNEDWQGVPKPFEFQRIVETAVQSRMTPPPYYSPPGPSPSGAPYGYYPPPRT
jgi:membrane protein YdbS with pleckstrin-like domain